MSGDHDHEGFSSRDLRILAVFIIMTAATLGTFVPTVILRIFAGSAESQAENAASRRRGQLKLKKVMRVLTAFSIGIILGTALLHLIPESSEVITESLELDQHHEAAEHHEDVEAPMNQSSTANTTVAPDDDHDDEHHDEHEDEHGHEEEEGGHSHAYPYAHLIALSSAFVMYTIERELHAAVARRRHQTKPSSSAAAEKKKSTASPTPMLAMAGNNNNDGEKNLDGTPASDKADDHKAHDHEAAVVEVASNDDTNNEEALEEARQMVMQSHIVDLGLAIHSIILGITLGLLTRYEDVRVLLIAVTCDQFADGVAVGSTLSEARLLRTWQKVLLRIIFAVSCASGVSIGLIIDASESAAHDLTQGILAAISGGMLLVIALANMLPVLTKPFNSLAECCVHDSHDDRALLHVGQAPGNHHHHEQCDHAHNSTAEQQHQPDHVHEAEHSHQADTQHHQDEEDEGSKPLSALWRFALYFCVILGGTCMAIIAKWG